MCKLNLIAASSTRLVCYFNSEAEDRAEYGEFTVSDIDPNQCTHLIYAFSDINNNEVVPMKATDIQQYQSFNGLKTRNPLLKTLLAVGGLTFDIQKFSEMVSEQQNRAKFIQSAITILRANGFDGLNIDWRNPRGAGSQLQDKQRFTLLCKELKEAFVAEGTAANRIRLIITASVSAEKATIDASYEVAEIAMHLDFINVLTFDFHGPWENVTGHHSPLYQGSQDIGNKNYSNTDFAMQYWRKQGAPTEKLNLGIAAYGRAFDLSTNASDVGAPVKGPGEEGCYTGEEGFWASYETCLYIEGVTTQLITDQKAPYAVTENQWVGFDNIDSLDTKVNYLKNYSFGGAFVWSLDLDDNSGEFCKMGKNPFISHLHTLLVPGNQNAKLTLSIVYCHGVENNHNIPYHNSSFNNHNFTYQNNAQYHNSPFHNHNFSHHNYNNGHHHNFPYHNHSVVPNQNHINCPYHNHSNAKYHNSPCHNHINLTYYDHNFSDHNNPLYHHNNHNFPDDHNFAFHNHSIAPYHKHKHNNGHYHNSPYHNNNNLSDYNHNPYHYHTLLYHNHNNNHYNNHNFPYHNHKNATYHNHSSSHNNHNFP
ncbi:chitinase-3-like protein 1 [Centropristis striata]|uniref:chitinase-3-like protein 1 n=1 Tax=Centropristis striata TaxID=184440 RepID=UPI0027E00228|nr:chitinase-3-like protein 1 [Centropristis striata]